MEVVGKPSLQALRTSAGLLGVEPSELAVVGDDPDLEVPMAHAGGAFAVAVHTGIGHAESFSDLPADLRPPPRSAPRGALAELLRADRYAVPRTAQARAVRWIAPSSAIGNRATDGVPEGGAVGAVERRDVGGGRAGTGQER